MKKLMIAAALAAVSLMGEAKTEPQAYDMTITLKTSWCNKKLDVMAKIDRYNGQLYVYRTQITRKLAGAFWGCDCDVIAAPFFWGNCFMTNTSYVAGSADPKKASAEKTWAMPYERDGFMFWDATDKVGFWDADVPDAQLFAWECLNVIGKKSSNVEGYWELMIGDQWGYADKAALKNSNMLYLAGAGYGSAKIYNVADIGIAFSEATYANYIKTMKGYTVGFVKLDQYTENVGCLYCGKEVNCSAFRFCTCDYCGGTGTTEYAPAFGTWTLKYNSSAVSKLTKGASILTADTKIPAFVRNAMAYLERGWAPGEKGQNGKASQYTGDAAGYDVDHTTPAP